MGHHRKRPVFPASDVHIAKCEPKFDIERFIGMDNYVRCLDLMTEVKSFCVGGEEWLLCAGTLPPEFVWGDWKLTNVRSGLARSLRHLIGQVKGDRVSFYSSAVVSEVGTARSIAQDPDSPIAESSTCSFFIWIQDERIRRVEIRLTGALESGEPVSLAME